MVIGLGVSEQGGCTMEPCNQKLSICGTGEPVKIHMIE